MNTIIELYQKCVSPFLGNHCRFYPSCSEYSRLVFNQFGFFRGLFLTVRRLLKCQPLHAGGVDLP